jgi:hypothetical protein
MLQVVSIDFWIFWCGRLEMRASSVEIIWRFVRLEPFWPVRSGDYLVRR